LRVLLRLDYASREDLAADYVTDLGEGGLFIRTDLDLEVGSRLAVSISFPGLLEPTVMDCVVRWKRPGGPTITSDQVGVGVEFAQPGSAQHERLTTLLAEIARPQKPRPKVKTSETFRVLLVEDNVFVSELFRHAVLKFQHELDNVKGHDLMVARTGHEALRMLENATPDVVILDHYLPGITGCSLVRKIRGMKEFEHTPILMISVGGEEIRREALESGATLYMDKPILLTQLLDTLRVLMARERACH
jgi:uncharacterized protein (TIGR02266 family)